jgi:hypothetical protein
MGDVIELRDRRPEIDRPTEGYYWIELGHRPGVAEIGYWYADIGDWDTLERDKWDEDGLSVHVKILEGPIFPNTNHDVFRGIHELV